MTPLQRKVLAVARHVRERMEAFAKRHGLGTFTWRGRPDLTGLCAVAAYGLMRALDEAGVHSVFEFGGWKRSFLAPSYGHCWLFVPRAFDVVDLTATQYRRARVVAVERLGPGVPYWGLLSGHEAIEIIERMPDWERQILPRQYEEERYWQ